MFEKVIGFLTAENLSAGFVYLVGSVVGAYAAQGYTPLQWAGAAMSVIGAILVAVLVRTWPTKAKVKAKV